MSHINCIKASLLILTVSTVRLVSAVLTKWLMLIVWTILLILTAITVCLI